MARIPQRNLPGDSELWGRSVDERIAALETAAAQNNQNIGTSFSNISGNLAAMSRQMDRQVWGGSNSVEYKNFGVTSNTFVWKAESGVEWPERATSAYVLATGIGSPVQSSSGTGTDYLAYGRLNIAGQISPEVPGIPFAVSLDTISLIQVSWSALVLRSDSPDLNLTTTLEMRAPNPSWYPASANSKAAVSMIVLFNADPDITRNTAY